MKKIMLLTSLAGGLFAATALLAADEPATSPVAPDAMVTNAPPATADQSDQTPQPATDADQAPATVTNVQVVAVPVVVTPAPDTNVIVVVPMGVKGLRMNFRGAPLEAVLNYMSAAAGFIINAQVPVTGKVTVWSEQPMDSKEAVALLQQMLSQNGFTAIQDGRTLTILRSDDAKTSYVRTVSGNDPDLIPKNSEIITQVIPVHSLNVVQLVKDLQPLKSPEATLTADESANALVMTGPQISIRRITEVVRALDSVTSSSATISVFPLQYADAKATADLIKDLFPNADTQRTGAGGGFNFGRFRGAGGGGGGFNPFGGGGGGADAENNGHTPTAKVSAVSDDHSNTLIVSAPDAMMDTISNLVHELDKTVDETTEEHTFHLKNADPMEMVNLLTSLFPDDTGAADATRQSPFRFGFPGAQQPAANTPSDRAKKIAHVVAVADPRTSSLLVTAGKDVMAGIITIVNDLDARNDRKQTAHVYSLQNADPAEVQQILQQLFPSSSTGSAQAAMTVPTTGIDPFADRRNTQLQLQNAQNPANFGGVSGTGATGSRTTGN